MKHILAIIQAALLLFSFTIVFSQENENAGFSAQDPVLITSAGQSADILMLKILSTKASLDYTLDKIASAKTIEGFKSVIIVSGGSTKGLGAAKIDKEEEYTRVEKLIEAAKKKNIPIIAAHIGGKSRRGALSDYFNKLVAENADHLIVVENGNQDDFFSKIAKEKGIEINLTEKIVLIKDILKTIYGKE